MQISYALLENDSAVFIYPGSRKFFPDQIPLLKSKLEQYVRTLAHIKMACLVKYDRFIVFVVSPDTPLDLEAQNNLVSFVLELEKEFDLGLIDKINVCFKQGNYVQVKEVKDFKQLIKNKGVSGKTLVFDSTVNNKYDFENYWEIPAENSWLSHWFKK